MILAQNKNGYNHLMRRLTIIFSMLLCLTVGSFPIQASHAAPPAGLPSYSTAYELIDAVNALRSANGLSPYRIDPILMSIAQGQADYMASIGTWTHTGPDGSRPYQRALNSGYLVAGDISLGGFFSENVIMGNNLSADEAIDKWMSDDPHKNTMLGAVYQDAGAGVAIVGNTYYYCMDVGLSTGGTPVAYTPSGPTPLPTILPNTPDADGSLIHVVQPGETLLTIAAAYDIPLADILRLNNLTLDSIIYPKQKITIRLAFTPTPTLPTPTASSIPTSTPWPTSTASAAPAPRGTSTPTPLPAAATTASNGLAIAGAIIILALLFAGITALLGKRKQ
jgi:uncharacterized protein YkwD/LysM repeat protein